MEDEVIGVVTTVVLPDWAESSDEGSEESIVRATLPLTLLVS